MLRTRQNLLIKRAFGLLGVLVFALSLGLSSYQCRWFEAYSALETVVLETADGQTQVLAASYCQTQNQTQDQTDPQPHSWDQDCQYCTLHQGFDQVNLPALALGGSLDLPQFLPPKKNSTPAPILHFSIRGPPALGIQLV